MYEDKLTAHAKGLVSDSASHSMHMGISFSVERDHRMKQVVVRCATTCRLGTMNYIKGVCSEDSDLIWT